MKLKRLKEILRRREIWRERVEQLNRMRQWVVDAENILNGSWVEIPEGMKGDRETLQKKLITNQEVALRFDPFLENLRQEYTKGGMSQTEQKCLDEFLRVLTNLSPHLIQCYDLDIFPRTNNDMEGFIRKTKARYRRISGRKNWNAYLLRHGRNAPFYDWWDANPDRWKNFEQLAQKIDRQTWKRAKKETSAAQSEQLKRFRFLHRRPQFLSTLEERWASATETPFLH
jgi:hypothetical protein